MDRLTPDVARAFRLQLQQAREDALKDAEAFDGIIHVMERMGSFLSGGGIGLSSYAPALQQVAERSPLAMTIPSEWRRQVHTPFDVLFEIVREARNDAMHIGAAARHLTVHAIELSLILEDALRCDETDKYVSDYMVRDPVCAELWEPVSFIRQRMLTNSFSYLPVKIPEEEWRLVHDLDVARYLQSKERKDRLGKALKDAREIDLRSATKVKVTTLIADALGEFNGTPILVFRDDGKSELVGIITAFDLL